MQMPASEPAAASKNRLVIYSAAEKQYCTGLLEGFGTRHPGIEIEFVFGISVALHERHLAELAAGTLAADVLWSSAMDLQMNLALEGKALPHASPEARALPPGAAYRDLAYATTVEPLMTLVHRGLYDVEVPAGSLAERTAALASGRFRGQVAAYDIARNGLGFLALLHESRHGADFDAFLAGIAACKPKTFGSNPALVDEVVSGRAALGYHVLGSYALRAVRANPVLAIAASNAPLLAISRLALISSRAPHPNAARLFVDYLLSQEGQRHLLKAGLFPIRSEAGDGSRTTALAPIRIDSDFDYLLDPERRRTLLSRWQAAVAGSVIP